MPTDIVPADTDTVTASPAQTYECYLDGTSHYPIDSEVARKVLAAVPDARELARASRAFTIRAARLMARRGISQFLDIGCGLATESSVHQTVQAVRPGARVLYTDNDPDVARNNPALSAGEGVAFMVADIRRPHGLLARAEEYNIDFGQPVGVLLIGVLHHLTWPETPHLNVAELTRRLAPGSHLALSHITCDGTSPDVRAAIETAYADANVPVSFHKPMVIKHFFEGLRLISPGWTDITQWRANGQKAPTQPGTVKVLAGVARKLRRPGR